jgi:putative heme-binding domain-containing protein
MIRRYGQEDFLSAPRASTRVCAVLAVVAWSVGALSAQHSYTPADIEDGGRLYQANCARCHGPDGDGVAGVNLGRGQFKRVTNDDEIVRTIIKGVAGTGMPPGNFSESEAGTIVAYLRSAAAAPASSGPPGDADRGRTLFEGRGQCLTCHEVNGRGSPLGPDLSGVGSLRRAAEIERSIVDPDAEVLSDYRFVQARTRDGATIRGRLLNQDLFTLQMLDSDARLTSLEKSSLREYAILKNSVMPSYRTTLSPQDVADVVSYLRALKGTALSQTEGSR